jgi:hypothetical protein
MAGGGGIEEDIETRERKAKRSEEKREGGKGVA